MRRTISDFGLLGAATVAASAPWAVPTIERRFFVLGLAAVAALIASLTRFRGAIERLTHALLFSLILAYCVLIALAVAAADDASSPYRVVFVVPVLFSATFFTGPARYSIAVIAPVIEQLIAGVELPLTASDTVVRIAIFLFIAHFAVVVAATLRESVRSARALHTVLEASTGDPLSTDLAEIGLQAALAVVGWPQGCVLVPGGGTLAVAAHHGIDLGRLAEYDAALRRVGGPRLTADALRTGRPEFLADIRSTFGPDHLLARDGVRAVAVLPLVDHGDRLGVLLLADGHARRVDDRVRERLERVARQLALALGSASAYRRETEASAQLRELNRRKDEFLANVSHELRTPAATIKLVAATLRSAADRLRPDQLEGMYETLERRSEHLVDLIEGLLEQAVAEAGVTRLTLTSIDWRDAVVRWAEIAQLQSGREITLHVPAGAVVGTGDAVKLERVVANLLSNAAKFSPPASPIVLALRAEHDTVEVEVTDEGIGIPEDELGRIFDRFHQVEAGPTRSAGGFGIGLSLARHFVEAHGGEIVVRSTLGEGTTFTVRVPRTPQVAPPPSNPYGYEELRSQEGRHS
ncbi:MAG TPA: ATP-binding protein [Acidimicrobiales bacterium]